MNKLMRVPLALCVSILSFLNLQAQEKSKIGFSITTDSNNAVSLVYSKAKQDNNYLNFRLIYGENYRFYTSDRQVIPAPDEIGIESQLSENSIHRSMSKIKLAVGPEFQIKESQFSWGVEGVLSWGRESSALINRLTPINEDGTVYGHPPMSFHSLTPHLEQIDRYYIAPGVQGRIALNTTLNKKVDLQLFASSSIDWNINYETTDRKPVEEPMLSNRTQNYIGLDARLGITVFLHKASDS